jgi:hypothetical protein
MLLPTHGGKALEACARTLQPCAEWAYAPAAKQGGKRGDEMPRLGAALLLSLLFASSAWAVECYPNCDYTHDYGPYDFTYVRPGAYGFPACNVYGECLPRLAYRRGVPYGGYLVVRPLPRIIIRPLPRVRRAQ